MKTYNFIDEVILTRRQLRDMSYHLSNKIQEYYEEHFPNETLHVISVLNGAVNFTRSIFQSGCLLQSFSHKIHYIKASSYGSETNSSGNVTVTFGDDDEEAREKLRGEIDGKPVLIIDDIYDTGLTLDKVYAEIEQMLASDIKCCVMIERVGKHKAEINPHFIGHKIKTKQFLVGAGLDFEGNYRNMPFVGALKPDFKGDHKQICLCNKCGQDMGNRGGLFGCSASGMYDSEKLTDCTAYYFDLCEDCVWKLFSTFSILVEEKDYDPWTGEIIE